MAYNPGGQEQAGADFVGALTDSERKTAAYNALSKAYGPAIADNPENALNAASASAQIPLAPQAAQTRQDQAQAALASTQANTEGQQLTNTQTKLTAQQMAAYRATQMLKSAANPDGSIPQDAFDKIVRPHADLFGIDPGHVDQLGQLLGTPGQGVQHLDTIAQGLIGPQQVTGAGQVIQNQDGTNSVVRFDKFGRPIVTNLGAKTVTQEKADTGNVNASTNQKKIPIAQQNADANTFRANTGANNSGNGNPGGMLPQGGAGGKAPAAAANQPVGDPAALFNRLPVGSKARQNAIGAASSIVSNGTQLRNSNILLDTVDKQISPYTAGTGTLLKNLPGSQQADLKANLKTLGAQGLTAWINSLKNGQGQTGIGRVLQSEANAAMTLFGNMEQDQSAKQLAFHTQLFRQAVNRLYQNQQNSYKQQYGVLPHEAAGTADPMQSAPPAGWKVIR